MSAVEDGTELDEVGAHPQHVKTHRGEMRGHDPAAFLTVGNDRRLDAKGRTGLRQRVVPQVGQVALADDLREVRSGGGKHAVISVELAISEPETVVGAGVEPAAIIIFRTLAQNCRGGTDIAGDAVDELDEVVGTGIEDGLAGGQFAIKGLEAADRGAVIAGRRRLRTEGIEAECRNIR